MRRIALFACLFVLSHCVVHFTNSEYRTDGDFRRVYLPSMTDDGTLGGNSLRLSTALRKKISTNTRIILTSMEDARWALDIAIKGRNVQTETWIDCKEQAPNKVVFSGSAVCENLGFNQSKISSEREMITMKIVASAIDLRTGSVMKTRDYSLQSPVFDVVGPEAVQTDLSAFPQLHALRYAENVDTQINNIAIYLADLIEGDFF